MKRRPSAAINRRNWKDTREYLDYCTSVRQCAPSSVEVYRNTLDHLLNWATAHPLTRATEIRPTYPQYLNELTLSVSFTGKCLSVAQAFFTWATANHPDRYDTIKPTYIASLILKRRESEVKEREAFTIEEVLTLVDTPALTLADHRDRAAVAFLFMSGMRDAAFCSLPIKAVDFDAYPPRVKQWPKLGVRTKFSKAATTMLLVEPTSLLKICREWDHYIRGYLPENAPWFPVIEANANAFSADQAIGQHRSFAKRLRALCQRADIEPKSPHKLRNAHIVYALKQCRDMADLKAVSQNVMHESIQTTEAVYAQLREDDIAGRIATLGDTGLSLFQSKSVPKQELSLHLTR